VAAPGKLAHPEAPLPKVKASTDPAVIERGRYLVHGPAHCAQCHSTDDRDHPEKVRSTPLHGGLAFPMGPLGTRYGRNLTPDKETGLGALSDAQIARTLRSGVLHDGEISFFMLIAASDLSESDITAVVSYLRSVAPVKRRVPPGEWALFGRVLLTYVFPPLAPRPTPAPKHVAPSAEPSVEQGAYLADQVAVCTSCHTKFDMNTLKPFGPKGGGSLPEPSHGPDSDMEFVAPNLTSHATGVTGRMTEDLFVARLKAGRVIATSIMPWEAFADITETDLRSIYRYLKTLPPADNDVGPSYRKIGWKPGN
jgi:mono/diheme cytochrome c family protein